MRQSRLIFSELDEPIIAHRYFCRSAPRTSGFPIINQRMTLVLLQFRLCMNSMKERCIDQAHDDGLGLGLAASIAQFISRLEAPISFMDIIPA